MGLKDIAGKVVKGISGVFKGTGGGLVSNVLGIVDNLIPDPAAKAQIELALKEGLHRMEMEVMQVQNEQTQMFNNRIQSMEGTANDLKSIPILGSIIIFLRGCQRPIWGFACLYIDFMTLSGTWSIGEDPQRKMLVIIINVLVLTFLFGERAMKNLTPLIMQFFGKK
jgi:hypothetical protein